MANIETLIDESTVKAKIQELGKDISRDYQGKELLVICVLKGSFLFCADLVRAISNPLKIEFMRLSSYGSGTQSSGNVQMLLDVQQNIEDKHVLVVEDIVDTGHTLRFLLNHLSSKRPASLKLASLLFKPARLEIDHAPIDYLGFEIEDKFVVGYGLDYDQRYRELPYIGVVTA